MHSKLLPILALTAYAAWAQQGALVFVRGGDAWIMNTDGSNQTRLTTTGTIGQVRLSNNVVAFTAGGQIYRATLAGRFALSASPQPIPNTTGVLEFDLSPDGSRLALTYFAGSNATLYTMNVDGTSLTPINSASLHQSLESWGRDGYIYFVQSGFGNALSQTLFRIPETGVNNAVQLTTYFSQFPSAGLPGNRVAFLYDYPVKRMRTMNADGTGVQDVPGLTVGDGSFISVDYFSDLIYYPIGDEIWRIRPDGSGNQLLASGVMNYVDYGTVALDNTPPVVTSVSIAPNPVPVDAVTTLSATFTDAGGSGLATSQYTVDGNSPQLLETLSGSAASGSIGIAGFAAAGVHTFCVRAQDLAGSYSPYSCTLLAVYDPSAGFVTGGGSLPANPGKNNFALSAKYQANASVPTGNFEFHPGANKFKATAFAWLVVSGNQAILQGVGEWNGVPGYLFEVTAVDVPGNDALAVRIWNGAGTAHQTALTSLGGGQIIIH